MIDTPPQSPETLAVHAGVANLQFRPVVQPIYQTSTFSFESAADGAAIFAGEKEGYIYTRMGNPTVEALERSVAELERGHKALACASGMAAIHTTFAALLQAGDHVICSEAVYGPTNTLLKMILRPLGIESTFVDTSDLNAVRRSIRPRTRIVYVETPGNPTLVISDIESISRLAHEAGALLVIDNTFMSPVLQQPLRLGADVIVHSMTKFINGHADVIAGVIIVKDEADYLKFRKVLNQLGGVLGPFDAFLVHRGIKTLPLRMEKHCNNALKVAKYLMGHPAVDWVRYPGLRNHPQYEIARKQMLGGGGLISFGLKGELIAGQEVMNHVKLCALAVSLGGIETLIQHPATMTHASMGREARRAAGITDGLVRLSVGIENVDEIIADLSQALDTAQVPQPMPRENDLDSYRSKANSGSRLQSDTA